MIGRTLSHFRILAKIGEGGMGVVYRAEDVRLHRPVALKKSFPAELTNDEERRLRFLREARAAAAVNHPNIATVYDIGEADGIVFIAMELVEGGTLRSRIGGKPLPVREALRLAVQMAEGMVCAHQARVIHRDLKPDNIALTNTGQVKILDFGLAKLREDHPGAGELSRLQTISGEMTQAGKVLGTAVYMSPEQARGEPVDERSDLFAFGTILYEMVTGRLPFQGRSNTDVLSAILRDQPAPASEVNPDVPAELQRIIAECLEKDPQERYQHADQLAVDLKKLKRTIDSDVQAIRTPSGPETAPGAGRRDSDRSEMAGTGGRLEAGGTGSWRQTRQRRLVLTAAATLLIAAGAVGAWRWLRPKPAFRSGDRVIVADFENATGRPEYDTAVRDAFENLLDLSPFVDVIRGDELDGLVKKRAGASASRIDAALARTLCNAGDCAGFVVGRVGPAAAGLRIEIDLHLGGEAAPAVTVSGQAAGPEETLATLHRLALDLRRDLGETPRSVTGTPPPTTRSLPAYQAYAMGLNQELLAEGSVRLLLRALELDPDFVQAYAYLGLAHFNLGDWAKYREFTAEAWRRSAGLPDQVRLLNEALFLDASFEFEQEADRLRTYIDLYPFDPEARRWLAWIDREFGDLAAALEGYRIAYELSPTPRHAGALIEILAMNGRAAELDLLVAGYRARRGEDFITAMGGIFAAMLRDDTQKTLELIDRVEREGTLDPLFVGAFRSTALLRAGRLEVAQRAVLSLRHEAQKWSYRTVEYDSLRDEIWIQSRRTGAPPPAPDRLGEIEKGDFTLLRDLATFSVDVKLKEPLAGVIEARSRDLKDSSSRFVKEEIAFARGCLAFAEGDAARAKAILEPLCRDSKHSHRRHVLARTFEALEMFRDAAMEYEAVQEHSHVSRMHAGEWALDQFRLARVYDRLGDAPRARQWYERFLAGWKDADPDLPEPIEARARLAALAAGTATR